jgi:DNA polymerase III subunit epsilon
MRQIFLDTETTGLEAAQGHRIIEIGCIEMVNRRLTGNTLHAYFNPERPNHPDAVRVHGLTDQFLADKPLFASVADALVAFVSGAEIVIHNAPFDLGFLDAELRRLKRPPFVSLVSGVIDTLVMARDIFPGKGSNSLDALCKRLEVDNSQRTQHGALLDAGLLAEVYIRMTRGQNALVIDAADVIAGGAGLRPAEVDLSAFDLPVLTANAEEAAAHEGLLQDIDKASGGGALWQPAVA